MKEKDDIIKALKLCAGDVCDCEQELCPYWNILLCVPDLHQDALDLINKEMLEDLEKHFKGVPRNG